MRGTLRSGPAFRCKFPRPAKLKSFSASFFFLLLEARLLTTINHKVAASISEIGSAEVGWMEEQEEGGGRGRGRGRSISGSHIELEQFSPPHWPDTAGRRRPPPERVTRLAGWVRESRDSL